MENNVLKVMIWGMEAGRLYWNKERRKAFFTYSNDFLQKGLDIAPLTASIYSPLSQRGMAHSGNTDKLYAGLPEFIADSLPDRWGNDVFRQWATARQIPIRHLTAVDRLAFIGKRSMGALEFEPAYEQDNETFSVDLQSLYHLAQQIFTERQNVCLSQNIPLHLEGLYKIGTSAGGMRPKAIIAINEKTGDIRSGQADLPENYTHFIIEFNEGKGFPFTLAEKAYYDMAINAGINMMPSRLIEIDRCHHFLTQRFDRENGKKIHIQTLAAMNPLADSYEDLFAVCRQLRLPANEIAEQYRRMVSGFRSACVLVRGAEVGVVHTIALVLLGTLSPSEYILTIKPAAVAAYFQIVFFHILTRLKYLSKPFLFILKMPCSFFAK